MPSGTARLLQYLNDHPEQSQSILHAVNKRIEELESTHVCGVYCLFGGCEFNAPHTSYMFDDEMVSEE